MSHPINELPRPLAFVLSGAGAFGSVQAGMLAALIEADIRPDLVVGTSAGALNGALFSAEGHDAVPTLHDAWRSMDRRMLFGSRRRIAANLLRRGPASDHSALHRIIGRHLRHETFDELPIRFGAVATDALSGEPEVVSHGLLAPALLASCAIPGVFPSVRIDGRDYFDGGVAANVPIRQAISMGAASVVVLDATPNVVASEVPRTAHRAALHAMSLMLRNQRSDAVDELAHRYRIVSLPSPTPVDMGSFNFGRTDELLNEGRWVTEAALAEWTTDVDSDDRN